MSKDVKDLEEFSRELQEQIMEQIRKRYAHTVIDYWQNPRNFRKINNPDGYAKVKGPWGYHGEGHCTHLAAETLRRAIGDCLNKKRP